MKRTLMVASCAFSLAGCVSATPPLAVEQRFAQSPQQGKITLASRIAPQVGEVVPIDVNVANGTATSYRIDHTQVFAITPEGKRVAPLPVSEAIRLSGDANSLSATLTSTVVTGLAGAALGAASGAAMGTARGSAGTGAIVGGTLGAVVGSVGGAAASGESLRGTTAAQIETYALQDRDVAPGYSINGYVFYPSGTYTAVEASVRAEENTPETIRAEMVTSPPG